MGGRRTEDSSGVSTLIIVACLGVEGRPRTVSSITADALPSEECSDLGYVSTFPFRRLFRFGF